MDVVQSKHNIFSPSSASIWRHCTASPLLARQSDYWVRDATYKGQNIGHTLHDEIYDYIFHDTVAASSIYPIEIYETCKQYYDLHMLDFCKHNKILTRLETYYSLYVDKTCVGGTPDIVNVFERNGEITVDIVDFKFGVAIKIYALRNPQLILYSEAVRRHLLANAQSISADATFKFSYCIIQPPRDFMNSAYLSQAEQSAAYEKIVSTLRKSNKIKKPIYALGKHCIYCKAKKICAKLEEKLDKLKKQLIL